MKIKKLALIIIGIASSFAWHWLQGEGVATTKSATNSVIPQTNLTGADLTGANLEGVSLEGVILCNTIMPDGKINNSNCKN